MDPVQTRCRSRPLFCSCAPSLATCRIQQWIIGLFSPLLQGSFKAFTLVGVSRNGRKVLGFSRIVPQVEQFHGILVGARLEVQQQLEPIVADLSCRNLSWPPYSQRHLHTGFVA
jgi:hypothetical protein